MEPAQALVDASANNEDAGSEGDVILEVPLEVVNKSKDQQIQFLLQRVCSLEKELRATKERLQQLESPENHTAEDQQQQQPSNTDSQEQTTVANDEPTPNDNSNNDDTVVITDHSDSGEFISENHKKFVQFLKQQDALGVSATTTVELRGKGLAKKTSSKDIKSLAKSVSTEAERKKVSHETQKKRQYIAKEILDTETHYVNALDTTVKIFLNPLMESGIVSTDIIHSIFSRIDVLSLNHHKFLSTLSDRVTNWHSDQQIGDLFIRETDFLVRYTYYVNNFNNAFALLNDYKTTNSTFAKFIEKCEKAPECNFNDLHSFLLQPIQRIPRYEMLIKDLLRNTHHNHPDYDGLNKALAKIEGITKYINEQKKNAQEIAVIESKIGEKNAKAISLHSRKFLLEGDLQLANGSKKTLRRSTSSLVHVFIFSNLMVICKAKSSGNNGEITLKLKDKLKLDEGCSVTPLSSEADNTTYGFEVEVEPKKRLLFITSSKEESSKWLQCLQDLFASYDVATRRSRSLTVQESSNKLL